METINETIQLYLNRFTGNLSVTGSQPVEAYGCTHKAQARNDSPYALVRSHKVSADNEYVAWLQLPRQNVTQSYKGFVIVTHEQILELPQGQWVYDDQEGAGEVPLGVWLPIRYEASFRRSGELNASTYWGNTYAAAYAQIAELDVNKAWLDDSGVKCHDGAPYWWTR